MSEVLCIKEYSAQYRDEIINLILDIQQNEFSIQIQKEDQPDLSDIPGYYQKGAGNFWIALYNSQVVGTISLLDIGNQQVALRKMFVAAAYRGDRYHTASKLLQKVLSWARQKEVTAIFLGTTDKFLAAHRFYEKHGFKSCSKSDLPGSFPVMTIDTRFYSYTL